MKRAINLASICFLYLGLSLLNPAVANPSQNTPPKHRAPLRLAQPDWKPLTAQQIRGKISDRSVVIDNTYETLPGVKLPIIMQGGCAPRETFFGDGRWQIGICQRVYRVFVGRWSIEPFRGGEWLCVESDERPKSCRFVWEGPNVDQIFMAFGTAPNESQLNDDFMPYRIGPPADRSL